MALSSELHAGHENAAVDKKGMPLASFRCAVVDGKHMVPSRAADCNPKGPST